VGGAQATVEQPAEFTLFEADVDYKQLEANRWIASKPDLLGGKPCVAGTRLSVDFLLELLADGATFQDIFKA